MSNIFNRHPYSKGKTYWQHFKFASKIGGLMFIGSIYFIFHACFPFIPIPKVLNIDANIQRIINFIYR